MEFLGYPVEDYLDVDKMSISFPKTIHISLAVCSKQCGNVEFIVDGSSQVCQHCGRLMFRTYTKEYRVKETFPTR